MKRPDFKEIKSYSEFLKYYWYLDELKAICKSLNLEYVGGKNELNNVIKAYFNGDKIPHKAKRKLKSKVDTLTVETPILNCGFTFNQKFRDFYIDLGGKKNLNFTADMVATVKAVKLNNDSSFTLGDLLKVKSGEKVYAKYDNSSCQWNKFLKDFCKDNSNDIYPDKLKTASKFWNLLRNSALPKVYSREFIESNKDKI